MKTIVSFTPQARAEILQWLRLNMRSNDLEWLELKPDDFIHAVFNRVSDRVDGVHEPEYELPCQESATGNAVCLSFRATDFIYEEIEE